MWSLNADGTFTQLTTWSGNDGWPASDGQGHVLYLSDAADRTVNLWRQPKSGGQATQITSFTEMDIHDWSLAANGKVAVAHRWDQLHRIDFDGESSTVTPLTITAPSDAMADAVESLSGKTTQAALSPDGKTVALIAGMMCTCGTPKATAPPVWSLSPKGEKKIQCGAPTATHCGLSLISPEPAPFTRPR